MEVDMDVDNIVPSDSVQPQMENTASSGERTCAHCGKVGNLERCGKCKATFYCSRPYQASDYANHKANCHAPKTRRGNDRAQSNKRKHDEEPVDTPTGSERPSFSTWFIGAHYIVVLEWMCRIGGVGCGLVEVAAIQRCGASAIVSIRAGLVQISHCVQEMEPAYLKP